MNSLELPAETRKNMRMERIKRLLHELEYELFRGFSENEIDEYISYKFVFPRSTQKDGPIICAFETKPLSRYDAMSIDIPIKNKLRLVGSENK